MSEGLFAAITTVLLVLAIAAWSVATGRIRLRDRRIILLAATTVGVLSIFATISFVVPRSLRAVISVTIGLALSGVLAWLAMRDGATSGRHSPED